LYSEYTKLLNGLLGLTNKQALVLTKLIEIHDTKPIVKRLLNRDTRSDIIEACQIDECNLSTYLTLFKSKGILVSNGNEWVFNPDLTPIIDNNSIKLIFNIEIQ
jgi:hypothetical protein